MNEHDEPNRPNKPSRAARGPRGVKTYVVAALAAVAVIVAVVVVIALLTRGDDEPDTAGVSASISQVLIEVEQAAEADGTLVLDLAKLRSLLENKLKKDYVVDLAATDDRRRVGIAAESPGGPCVLVWSAVGGPRSATVDDRNFRCLARAALVQAQLG
ncbi:MAG: hypothetical protein ACKVWR_16680 [Acidimicrobiales bacterium]